MTFSIEDSYWNDVAGVNDVARKTASLVRGKVATAAYWPYLSGATSERDFDNRLSVFAERIEAAVDPDVYADVVSSLRDDYRAVKEASRNSAGSTSPELAPVNDALRTRKADLNQEYFDWGTQSWVRVARGINDPGHDIDRSSDNPYTNGSRISCAACNGWGKYGHGTSEQACDGCHGKGYIEISNKTATNYQPDPNREWRYHQEYDQLRTPPNNGALQDSDGFVIDLAQGEDRSNPIIEQRQLTPGTWTSHDAMPERPMPFSQERGYQPVGAKYADNHRVSIREIGSDLHNVACKDCNYGEVTSGRQNADWLARVHESDPEQYLNRNASLRFDKEGFLVESYEGRGVDQLADPVVGAPQRVNPYYFNTEEAAMGSNEGFPVDPSVEPLEDRANSYGDVAPQVSSGSNMGTSDGKGYSRSNPGESPNFSQRSATVDNPEQNKGFKQPPWFAHNWPDWQNQPTPARYGDGLEFPEDRHDDYGKTLQNHANYKYVKQRGDKWVITQKGTGKVLSEHDSQEKAEASFRAMMESKHGNKLAATDGKIIDHCPGCDTPRRLHTTAHGDELRHIHNDHVRCHGDKTSSKKIAKPFDEYEGMDDEERKRYDDFNRYADPHFTTFQELSSHPDYSVGGSPNEAGKAEFNRHKDHYMQTFWDHHASTSLPQFFDPTLSNGSVHTADYLGRPDANNPTGRGPDEYKARTWNAYETTRPMQSMDDRNINTPVLPGEQIHKGPDINTPQVGLQTTRPEDNDEDEED